MSDEPGIAWELVREIGLEYAASDEATNPPELHWPVAAGKLLGGGHLIVDELAVYNGLPLLVKCRTLILSAEREVTYDSRVNGISDGYGCPIDEHSFALLRRTSWDLLVLTHAGDVIDRIDLSRVSKHLPRILSWTDHGTFLITFLTRSHSLDIVEIDRDGRVLWYLPESSTAVGVPGSMQLLPDGSILVADEFRHVVQAIHRDGSGSVRWGKWAWPSADPQHLSSPKWAKQLDDGSLLIADTHNHRILRIEPEGLVREIETDDRSWFAPCFVDRLEDGGYLVCDQGNQCVVEIDGAHRTVWQAGTASAVRRLLSFPRSVEYPEKDHYVIADTAANRVIEVDPRGLREYPHRKTTALFWPRAARLTSAGSLLIADGRNSRVLELSCDGRVRRELTDLRFRGKSLSLQDPHDVRLLPNLHLLITDAAQDLVLEADWDGRVVWAVGGDHRGPLKDPHSAQLIPDGRVLICDSGNHRLLLVDPQTGTSDTIREFRSETAVWRFRYPRYAEDSCRQTLMVVDSGNNRVLASERDGRFLWELSCIPGSPISSLRLPRWAHLISRDEVLVTDHFHHRILHLRNRNV